MPETFSCERARTDSVGVTPQGAQVRRSTGIIKKPVSSRQIRWAPRRRSFFYPGPVVTHPRAHPLIVALLGTRLRSLRAEATRAEQSPYVIGVVDDVKAAPDQIDEAAARPQAGAIAGGFRSGHHQARELAPLGRAQLRRSPGGRARAQAAAALASVRALPATDRASIDAETLRHDMNGGVTLKEFDRAQASPLELSRTPLWAHAVPPTEEHSVLGHYLRSDH
jgi:hypothetical protein